MTDKLHIRVPYGKRIFEVLEEDGKYKRPQLSEKEKATAKAEKEEFSRRCRQIFEQVSSHLIKNYYDWAIMIEPKSGEYFIDSDEELSFQKAKDKHPNAELWKCV